MTEATLADLFAREGEKTAAVLEDLRLDQPSPAMAGFEEFERKLRRLINWEEDEAHRAAVPGPDWEEARMTCRRQHKDLRELVELTRSAMLKGDERAAEKRRRTLAESLRLHLRRDLEVLGLLERALPPVQAEALRQAWEERFG